LIVKPLLEAGLSTLSLADSIDADSQWEPSGMNAEPKISAMPPAGAKPPDAAAVALLLIAGDHQLASQIRELLAAAGMLLELAAAGERGLVRALEGDHDLIVLDYHAPGVKGLEILRQIRRRRTTPVILFSDRAGRDERIAALEAGGDDFLTIPLDSGELPARIRAILRRAGRLPHQPAEIFQVNGVKIAVSAREAWVDNRPMNLTTIEFEVLEILARNAGRVVSRAELTTLIHQRPAAPLERSLDVHVSHLRRKLGDRGALIRTIRGVGYLFQAELPQT